MACKHLHIRKEQVKFFGDTDMITNADCSLKMESEGKKHEIYDVLQKKGLEGTYVRINCPFVMRGNYSNCPYCEE